MDCPPPGPVGRIRYPVHFCTHRPPVRIPASLLAAGLLAASTLDAAEVAPPVPPEQRSRQLREAIRAALPKYSDKPAEPGDQSMEVKGQAEEREGVVHLPTVTIRSKKGLPGLTEYEMLTPKGRLELARKRYPGIGWGNALGLNNGIALFMLQEEMDAAKRDDLKERVQRTRLNALPDSKEIDGLIKAATQQPDRHWAGQKKP